MVAINDIIKEFKERLVPLELQAETIRNAIKAIQEACPHEDSYSNDHYGCNNYYKCPTCEKEWWG